VIRTSASYLEPPVVMSSKVLSVRLYAYLMSVTAERIAVTLCVGGVPENLLANFSVGPYWFNIPPAL
jgi:hypothetical protein